MICIPIMPLSCHDTLYHVNPKHNTNLHTIWCCLKCSPFFLPSFTSLKDVRSIVGCKDGSCKGYSSERKRLHAPHVGIPNNFVCKTYCTTRSTSIILFSQIFKFSEFAFNKYIWEGKFKKSNETFQNIEAIISTITLINKPKKKTETLCYWTSKILVPSMISSYFT